MFERRETEMNKFKNRQLGKQRIRGTSERPLLLSYGAFRIPRKSEQLQGGNSKNSESGPSKLTELEKKATSGEFYHN